MSDIARIIRLDGVEAVQLPPGFEFDVEAVRIRRDGDAVILEPIAERSDRPRSGVRPADVSLSAALAADWASFPRLPDDLADELPAIVEEEVPQQDRPELGALFE